VAEAVCFGVPDEKYGEVVAAAVVLRPGVAAKSEAEVERSVKELCAAKLSAFKVRLFGEITSFETLLEQGIFTPKKKASFIMISFSPHATPADLFYTCSHIVFVMRITTIKASRPLPRPRSLSECL